MTKNTCMLMRKQFCRLALFFRMFPCEGAPPENIRKPLVFWCSQGVKRALGRKG